MLSRSVPIEFAIMSPKAYHLATFVLFPLTTVAMAMIAYKPSYRPVESLPDEIVKPIKDRRAELRLHIAAQHAEAARTLNDYSPRARSRRRFGVPGFLWRFWIASVLFTQC